MFATLTNLGYYIPSNRQMIGKVNYNKMRDEIFDFFNDDSIKPDDTLLFYYSGHGVLDKFGESFFATSEIDSYIPERRGIKFDYLTNQMTACNNANKIAILDCCFSGGATPKTHHINNIDLEKYAEIQGNVSMHNKFDGYKGACILASSLSDHLSYKLPGKSISTFTHFVLKGLNGEKRDAAENDGHITPISLGQYVFSELERLPGCQQKSVMNLTIMDKISLAEYSHLKSKRSVSNSPRIIPIDEKLLIKLQESKEYCKQANIPYRTPNLLLTLLQIKNSFSKKFLNEIVKDKNLGEIYHKAIEDFVSNKQRDEERGNKFKEFDWEDREDIRLAQYEALFEKSSKVKENHLLVGILCANSNTSEKIREQLGVKFSQLLQNARMRRYDNHTRGSIEI